MNDVSTGGVLAAVLVVEATAVVPSESVTRA
jgi:hypothetical protein